VRTARFLATRVVAVVEHPMDDAAGDDEATTRRRVRRIDENQPSLGIES
jgi:hypothetical protein